MLRNLTIFAAGLLALSLPLPSIAAEPQHGGGNQGGVRSGGGNQSGVRSGGPSSARSSGPSVGRSSGGSNRRFDGGGNSQRRAAIAPSQPRPQVQQRQRIRESGNGERRVGHRRDGDGAGRHYSHRRHHWHGRWWYYGVGSCWAYDNRYDEYYWTCDDDY